MNYKAKRLLRKIKGINIRGVAALIAFLLTLAMLGYYGFMKLEKKRIAGLIENRTQEVTKLQKDVKDAKNDPGYKKYVAAKTIHARLNKVEWKDNIEYLINLLDELTALDQEDRSILLENFQINETKISLRGTISSISTMYREGGIIDKFTEFPFVTNLKIPFYRRNGDFFQFILDANIKGNEG